MSEDRSAIMVIIAKELKVKEWQVTSAIRLLDEGATVPFIARYRKEDTGELDDSQLRHLAERLLYLRELDERRTVIINSISEQDKLTPELEQAILAADTKTRLEDLYLPYRPKRRTKAQLAIEAGLEPLAHALWHDSTLSPEAKAEEYIQLEQGIIDVKTALEGARNILIEQFAEDAELINELREYLWQHAILSSTGSSKNKEVLNKFSDYFSFSQPIHKIPSHRALALFRGRRESVLQLSLTLPESDSEYGINKIAAHFKIENQQRAADHWLHETVRMTWKVKLFAKFELELLSRLRELADDEAIKVFSKNLHDLLLAAPAGSKITMGLDPGIRTGVKVVVVDSTGKLLDYTVIFPFAPQNEWHQSIAELAKLAAKNNVDIISIGNGTGSRETERLVSDLIKMYPDLSLTKVIVSEAGASVYSASALAAAEFPDLDVTLRGAVSIARRLQDPLAELVKIEAKSIGVGQYQHDVNQNRLARCLDGVVEDCVNAVGVDVNTASSALLSHISGLNDGLAKNIVQHRDEHGAFTNREQLKNINRMGEKAFQQAAGFLRIMHGDNPLDASCVHPEAYPIVQKIIGDKNVTISQMIGNKQILQSVNIEAYVDTEHGLATIRDIIKELEKPGRDPRPEFKTAQFKEGVENINHLNEGMILEGVVSNVTNFGAFVDIGVHQDGLVHISEMTNRFISDPQTIVKAGDIVTVRVMEVNKERKRISLSMKLELESKTPEKKVSMKPPQTSKPGEIKRQPAKKKIEVKKPVPEKTKTIFNTAMADALSKLRRGNDQ
ncbi:MAG: RNA-binding transcriptional accessory protein [Legionella sp.]|nr:RNA-binding transcriptional accessory protein [Legionella sp.]